MRKGGGAHARASDRPKSRTLNLIQIERIERRMCVCVCLCVTECSGVRGAGELGAAMTATGQAMKQSR